jgi:carbamoyl-phosphate synthase large subunit
VGGRRTRCNDLEREQREPTPERIFAIAEAIKQGYPVDHIHQLSRIDRWFLDRIRNVVAIEERLHRSTAPCPPALLREAKQAGFSDRQIGGLIGLPEGRVRDLRLAGGIVPCVKQIDTLAAEYPARTNYLYLTYNGQEDDVAGGAKDSVIVLGSGAYRISSSVEFDWCCVSALRTLGQLGYATVLINHNPETVSTDYNECDKLFFDELSLETVLDIYQKENPVGVVIAVGGQIPNNLATQLHAAGVKVLGTSPRHVDVAEDRHKFSRLLDQLQVEQPVWNELVTGEETLAFANCIGYPVIVRPSYVLSGAAMGVASNDSELTRFLYRATEVSHEHPVVISKFIEDAKELEIDAVARGGELVAWAISEHVENAGVHSGDATLVFPPQRTYLETIRRIKNITKKIARALEINGPFNIQFVARDNHPKVIECNLRASRSFPFVSKILKVNLIDLATRIILGEVPKIRDLTFGLDHVGVKAPQFSFTRLDGADPTLGVEMASTGEVACLGDDFEEAFLKAFLSVGFHLPVRNVLLSTGPVKAKAAFLESAKILRELNVKLFATRGTAEFLREHGIDTVVLNWPLEDKRPNVTDFLRQGEADLVINIPKNYQEEELTNDYIIRRRAVDFGIPLITNIQLAQRFVEAILRKTMADLEIKSWGEY